MIGYKIVCETPTISNRLWFTV